MTRSVKYFVTACFLLVATTTNAQTTKFIDVANMDPSVKPGDNFYQYANGNWIKNTPVPASKTRWGSFDALGEESSQALKGLLEDAAQNSGKNNLMKRVGDYYAWSPVDYYNRPVFVTGGTMFSLGGVSFCSYSTSYVRHSYLYSG
ncbi:MAG TPA: M13 family metallopeptidase N-terminal domain-containing protein, partial [Ferruginibacter sp.]|nr:M13 family metallopeptidase N-terminal domain-containing protein [Ferruginibacter sp.]